jgi:hypothetical protein
MPSRFFVVLAALAQLVRVAPLAAQTAAEPDWRLEGLRTGFCVELLLDPASDAMKDLLKDLPEGYRPVPASEARDLPVSLRAVVEGQPEFASWSPSRLCFHAVDTIRTSDIVLGDRSGRRPQLFAYWTVMAAAAGGSPHDVVLNFYSSSDRLARSARLKGQIVREARLVVGKPPDDENGMPSTDDRIQVKLGKTLVTWDGRLVGDSIAMREPVAVEWVSAAERGGVANGRMTLAPAYSRPMAGALKVEGKDDMAKALKASPTRFVGPAYRGGGGSVTFRQ